MIEKIKLKKFKDIKKQKYDLVIETTGNLENIQNGFDFLNKNGKLILVGQPKLNSVLRLKNPLRLFNPPSDNIKIISSDGGKFNPDNEMKILINIVKNNFKYLKKLITHEIKLSEINKGIDIIKKGEAGRVVINFK
jgi:S-(hydroxymethyl)glutathione dehydrogenase/alcohol dehydrogenase